MGGRIVLDINNIFISRVRFLFLIVVSIFLSCEKKITDEQFEQRVLSEIFVRVVDSTYKDKRVYASFPERGEDIYNKNGKWVGRDTIGQHKRDIDYEIKIEALKKDTLNLIIAIGKGGLINDKIDLQNYNSRKFIFRHLSELPPAPDYKSWTVKHPKFAGVLVFSKIKFDVRKQYGTLEVSYYCGERCGLGYVVTIKRIDDKWVVSKVEDTWIS
ncbi:hypothetical protein ACVWYN_001922 [Pedobacter sp. UYP24]